MSVYNEISNKFFDECDAQLEKSKKIKKISMLTSAGSLVLFVIIQTLADKTGLDALAYIALIALIAMIAGLIVCKIFRKKIKNAIKELEGKYYDDVYMQIVAKELDATANCNTYINTEFKKEKAISEIFYFSRYHFISSTISYTVKIDSFNSLSDVTPL